MKSSLFSGLKDGFSLFSVWVSDGSREPACAAGIAIPFWDRHSRKAGGSKSEPRHTYFSGVKDFCYCSMIGVSRLVSSCILGMAYGMTPVRFLEKLRDETN